MTQVFVSYASKDGIFADLVRMKLKDRGFEVWLDNSALRAGDEWRRAIDQGISSSEVLLVVVSPQSCQSAYVTYEWAYALGKGVAVIPLILEDSADLHPRLAVLQYLDFRNHKASPWDKLEQEIASYGVNRKNPSSYVRDVTLDQLHAMISSAVALEFAKAKSSGHAGTAEGISQTAQGVIDVVQLTGRAEPRLRRILWVDDRPSNNTYERSALEALGFEFTLALSTNEALRILSTERFAVIISDMGRIEGPREGYVLLNALRGKGDDTPFIIYAGSNAKKHKLEASEHGAQGSTNDPQELFYLVTQSVNAA